MLLYLHMYVNVGIFDAKNIFNLKMKSAVGYVKLNVVYVRMS